jgi:hypothetical protein
VTGRREVEILNILDDHSRSLLACARVIGVAVVDTFKKSHCRIRNPVSVYPATGWCSPSRFAAGRASSC